MFGQEKKFSDFVASRSLAEIENWAETLLYPVLRAGGTKPVPEKRRGLPPSIKRCRIIVEKGVSREQLPMGTFPQMPRMRPGAFPAAGLPTL